MAVREIITVGNPILREPTETVDKITKKVTRLIRDMLDTMYDAEGVGLAAPQIGVLKKIAVIDIGEGPLVLINPKIVASSGSDIDVEGCLSIPNKQAYVKRYAKVQVEALNEKGKPIRIVGTELLSRALQHEIDHLNGILYIDLIDEEDLFDKEEQE